MKRRYSGLKAIRERETSAMSPWLEIVDSQECPDLPCVIWHGDEYLIECFTRTKEHAGWIGCYADSWFSGILIRFDSDHDYARLKRISW
jgi:hypothetical protein